MHQQERDTAPPHIQTPVQGPPLMQAKPISPPTSLIRHSHVAGETLLSNPPFTIPDPPKTDLILDPPKTDLVIVVENRRHC